MELDKTGCNTGEKVDCHSDRYGDNHEETRLRSFVKSSDDKKSDISMKTYQEE